MKYLFVLCVILFSCNQQKEAADIIYTNAIIFSGDSTAVQKGSIAIRGNSIIYTGIDDAAYRGDATIIKDLQGKLVVPGFIDNHTHFLAGGHQLGSINLRGASTKQQFIQIIKEYCASHQNNRWVLGGNWDHEAWGGELPSKEWIDSVCGEHPLFVSRYDGHMAFANSKALQLANITALTPTPSGGEMVRKNNALTGVLKDEAMNLLYKIIPNPSAAELDEYLYSAQQHALENGVTQLVDMNTYGGFTDLECYRRVQQANNLQVRIYSFAALSDWKKLDSFCKKNGKGNDMLHWGGVKGFVDGSLGSTTAWFYLPYLDAPGNTGLQVTDTLLLKQWVMQANAAGLQVAVHAIGDRANDYILDVFEEAQKTNAGTSHRFRVEHAQHLTPNAIARFAQLGVVASMQPYHAIDDGKWAHKRLDSARLKGTYAFRSLLANNATLSFGSDWPVAPLTPIEGIYAAVTRQTLDGKNQAGWYPAEKISVAQALSCYTNSNAYANYMETKTGKIKAGMLADMVVLGQDIFSISPEKIKDVKVLMTIVDGKLRYQRK